MIKFAVTKNRKEKYLKIKNILEKDLGRKIENKKILDIGTGNGEIADFFAAKNKVYSVDTFDQRKNTDSSVIFIKISNEKLPFPSEYFDIVISNHVGEHTPDWEKHLEEIYRVINLNGVCYLASPNRFFPWEGHYNVWFIHYFPKKIFVSILKKRKIFQEEINLLSYIEIKKKISKLFTYREYTHYVIKYPKKFYFSFPLLHYMPIKIIKLLNIISQTNIFILRKK